MSTLAFLLCGFPEEEEEEEEEEDEEEEDAPLPPLALPPPKKDLMVFGAVLMRAIDASHIGSTTSRTIPDIPDMIVFESTAPILPTLLPELPPSSLLLVSSIEEEDEEEDEEDDDEDDEAAVGSRCNLRRRQSPPTNICRPIAISSSIAFMKDVTCWALPWWTDPNSTNPSPTLTPAMSPGESSSTRVTTYRLLVLLVLLGGPPITPPVAPAAPPPTKPTLLPSAPPAPPAPPACCLVKWMPVFIALLRIRPFPEKWVWSAAALTSPIVPPPTPPSPLPPLPPLPPLLPPLLLPPSMSPKSRGSLPYRLTSAVRMHNPALRNISIFSSTFSGVSLVPRKKEGEKKRGEKRQVRTTMVPPEVRAHLEYMY